MSRLTILCDVDGTLADFMYGFTELAHEMFGTPIYRTIDTPFWDQDDYASGLTKKQRDEVWDEIRESPTFWANLSSVDGGANFSKIHDENVEIIFATHRIGKNVVKQTTDWLYDHCLFDKDVNVVLNPAHQRGQLVKALGADYFIDDKAGNAVYAAYESPDTEVFLVDRLYNQYDPRVLGRPVKRVASVQQFVEYIAEKEQ